MPIHLFTVGSTVSLNVDGWATPSRPSEYVVEAQMPPVGTSLQYRIKSESEGFRRVVAEHQLSVPGRTASTPAPIADRSTRPHPGEAD